MKYIVVVCVCPVQQYPEREGGKMILVPGQVQLDQPHLVTSLIYKNKKKPTSKHLQECGTRYEMFCVPQNNTQLISVVY